MSAPESVRITLHAIPADHAEDLAVALGDRAEGTETVQEIDQVVAEIADKAMHAAFSVIAEEVGEVSGDFAPEEVADLERVFGLFVRAMCANTKRGSAPTPPTSSDLAEIAECLDLLADIDEGENTDTDRLRSLARSVRTGYNIAEGSAMLAARRHCVVRGARSAEEVAAYLPTNYSVSATLVDDERGSGYLVCGEDVAGWTLEGYVIPRLASGLMFAEEVR